MKRSLLLTLGLCVALVASGVLLWTWQQRRTVRDRVDALVREAEQLAAEPKLEREAVAAQLRKLGKDPLAATDPALLRARARLELALERPQAAADLLEPLLGEANPSVEDLALAAESMLQIHAQSGSSEAAFKAMAFAEKAAEKRGGDAALLLLAWKAAVRVGRGDDADRIAAQLERERQGTREARLVAALRKFDRADVTGLDGLLSLEQELPRPDPELAMAIATLQLHKQDQQAVAEAVERIGQAVRLVPAYKEIRHVAALAFHAARDQRQRDLHLNWLLQNAKGDDRVESWRQLLAQPVGN